MYTINSDEVFDFSSILQSPKIKTYIETKKSRKKVFPKLVPSVYFQKGLNHKLLKIKNINNKKKKNKKLK